MKIIIFIVLIVFSTNGNCSFAGVDYWLAVDLYRVYAPKFDDNFLIAPTTTHTHLASIGLGAHPTTALEINTALHFLNAPELIKLLLKPLTPYMNVQEIYKLVTVNKLYIDKRITVKSNYITMVKNIFQTSVESINFRDRQNSAYTINDWVSEKTLNNIQDVVEPWEIFPNIKAIVINTMYLEANWKNPFTKLYISNFRQPDTESVPTHFMSQRGYFKYFNNGILQAEFIEIPFVGTDIFFTIALPYDVNGLVTLEKSLLSVIAIQPYSLVDIVVSIPKFRIETSVNMTSYLRSLGITLAFSNAANFQEITNEPFHLSVYKQKAVIEINEQGMNTKSSYSPGTNTVEGTTKEFIADRPFIYFVSHTQLGVLFAGRYVTP